MTGGVFVDNAGPGLDELVSARQDDRRKKRGKTAIIIPCRKKASFLEEHVRRLGRQDSGDFDVIAVYGEEDGFIASEGVGMLHLRRAFDFGSAGAFYSGQRCALEEGYENIIMADDDCWPAEDGIVRRLAKALETHPVVKPKIRFMPSGKRSESVICQYGAMRREVLENVGLTYLPLYSGGEDFDLERRICDGGFRIEVIDAVATHPDGAPFVMFNPDRLHHYSRGMFLNLLLSKRYPRAALVLSIHFFMAFVMWLNGFQRGAEGYARAAWSAAGMHLMREEMGGAGPLCARAIEPPDVERWVTIRSEPSPEAANIRFFIGNGGWRGFLSPVASRLYGTARTASGCFGKEVLFKRAPGYMDAIPLMVASHAALAHEGRIFEIKAPRGVARILADNALMLAVLPFIPVLGAAFAVAGALNMRKKGIDSTFYGVQARKA